jgi:type III pantothenate kinase
MLLAINCNNTNIKFGVVDGDRIVGEWRQHTSAMRTADEHAGLAVRAHGMEGIDPKSVTDAIIGSVVPQANFNLRRLCTRYLNCEPLFIGEPNVIHGIKIKGVGAGADRICNTVGASLMFPVRRSSSSTSAPPPTSTSSTRRAAIAAGAIAPGPNLSIEALVAAAALLPRIRRREAGEGDRHDDCRLHAHRRVLGLCRPDRGHRHAHQGRVRQAHEGGLDRRSRPGV